MMQTSPVSVMTMLMWPPLRHNINYLIQLTVSLCVCVIVQCMLYKEFDDVLRFVMTPCFSLYFINCNKMLPSKSVPLSILKHVNGQIC